MQEEKSEGTALSGAAFTSRKMGGCHFWKFLPVFAVFSRTTLYDSCNIKERKGYIAKEKGAPEKVNALPRSWEAVTGIGISGPGLEVCRKSRKNQTKSTRSMKECLVRVYGAHKSSLLTWSFEAQNRQGAQRHEVQDGL